MAKENPDTKPKAATPFRKFEQLAKKLVRVPKRQVEQAKHEQGGKPSTPPPSAFG